MVMNALKNNGKDLVLRIGIRKFIRRDSPDALLNKNAIKS